MIKVLSDKNLLYARKKGQRYRLVTYQINIKSGQIDTLKVINNNLLFKENLETIKQTIDSYLLDYLDINKQDVQLILPIYILEEDQIMN